MKVIRFAIVLLALGVAALPRPAAAQTVAVGTYYATPSWDQTLPCTATSNCPRFIVLSNFNNEAVLDRETGLVWQRTPLGINNFRPVAVTNCALATTGGRQGWRLPRVEELLSLADATNNKSFEDHLPPGHPFQLVNLSNYWAADRIPADLSDGAIIVFFSPGGLYGGYLNTITNFQNPAHAWCVRGGNGSDVR